MGWPRHRRSPRSLGVVVTAIAATGLLVVGMLPSSAAVPSGWDALVKDTFTRTSSTSWASAESGGEYKVSGKGTVATTGTTGTATVPAGGHMIASLPGVSALNVDVSDTVKFTSSGTYDLMTGWRARVQSDGSAYTARVRVSSSGKATIGVSRINGTSNTWLDGATLPFRVSSGQSIVGELQVTGTSVVQLNLRAWVSGSATPAWQVQYSDSASNRIQKAGAVGVYDSVVSAPNSVKFTHDDLSVGSNDGSADASEETADDSTTTADDPSRGSQAVGSSSYTPPAGAIFVDPSKGSDSNSGSQSSPMKTVVAAAAKASSGGTLVLRAGTYHESLVVASNKTITIQNYPGEEVWFDGSTAVTNWTKSGSTWVSSGWTKEFSSTMGSTAAFKARFIGSNAMAAHPDQVFVNGRALTQVGSASAVKGNAFYVNDAANTITIGTDPSGKSVRASDLAQAINLSGPNSVVRGIGVRRYANGYEVRGAVRLGNIGGTLRNVVIQDVATIGLSLGNKNKVIDHVTVQRAGMLGIAGNQTDNSQITNSVVTDNNTEHFKDAPVSGGIKMTAARTMTIDNVDASDNEGSCIWFDVSSYKLTIVNNIANRCTKHGIEVEVSDTGIIANNVAKGGGEDGIIIFDSGNFKVFNNEVGGSSLFGIKLVQDERRQATLGSFAEARDSRYKNVVDSTITWVTRNIQISNNVFGNGGSFQLYALDGKTNRAVDSWGLVVTGNLFNPRLDKKTQPTMVAWGKGDNKTLERYETPTALAAAKNSSWKNAQVSASKSIDSMSGDAFTYASTAVPIPSDVAAASGLPSGQRLLGVQ